ncbi:MAG: hypothetical protein IKG82_04520 [Oscillospiraceae bacterium]|nr:hypothetical protein [Oscillospiraceae bacterium]MBR3417937.1 hypothetical protein [Oscillospiraceae bacterium]
MTNREQKLHEELLKSRANIQRTKELIAFHRDVLRRQERKADEINTKLNAEKMKSLYTALNASGVDIDTLRQAVENGQLTDKTAETADAEPAAAKKEDT